MSALRRRGPRWRLTHPQTTVRWRLTLLYGGLFLVSGAALLAITYSLVAHSTASTAVGPNLQVLVRASKAFPPPSQPNPGCSLLRQDCAASVVRHLFGSPFGRHAVGFVVANQRVSDLHQLEIVSAIALAIMAVLSAMLGWVIAGRVLRPLRTITATTREISEVSLHRRLAMAGPRDELRQLADTIDGLLERLEGAFEAQRRFVANASHELRTPLTAARAMLEMVMTDPRADVETFRATCGQVLSEQDHEERLIDALLALAQGQRGLDRRAPVDLANVVRGELARRRLEAARRHLEVDVTLEPAVVLGEERLLERLVSNLLENAIRHNAAGGEVRVAVESPSGRPTLRISNTGPAIAPEEIARLLQPFQRLERERIGHGDGLGLGLSIVAAVAEAHGATLQVQPRAGGGLQIAVEFPPPPRTLPPAQADEADPDRPATVATR
jgi:signal transduction histidine kinase